MSGQVSVEMVEVQTFTCYEFYCGTSVLTVLRKS